MSENKSPAPADVYAGSRLRLRRRIMGLSQKTLAEQMNLTFQQIQKYEKGTNCIAVSRLVQLTKILDVPPEYFFEANADALKGPNLASERELLCFLQSSEGFALNKAFVRLPNNEVRRRVIQLVETLQV